MKKIKDTLNKTQFDTLFSPKETVDSLNPSADYAGLLRQHQQLASRHDALRATNHDLTYFLIHFETLTQKLMIQLARYEKLQYGASTEKMTSPQLALFEQTQAEDLAAMAQIQDELAKLKADLSSSVAPESEPEPAEPKKKVARQRLPEHLERQVVTHLPKVDGVDEITSDPNWVCLGEEVKEELDVIPAKFFVRRHVFLKFVHRLSGEVRCAARDSAVIDGGYASSELLSWVVGSKFLDHLPLYRLEEIAARQGVSLPRSTLADWVGRVGSALDPLYEAMKVELLKQSVLHADETPVDQLSPQKPQGNQKAYLWVYRNTPSDDQADQWVVFDYQTSRSGEHPTTFLKTFKGHLMVDGYSGYKALFNRPDSPLTELACMAHARRKFFELGETNNPYHPSTKVLAMIGSLYRIEQSIRSQPPPERERIRRDQAIPILETLHAYLCELHTQLAPGSATFKAVNYSLTRWEALCRYAQTGHLPIDNNPAENAIRPIALGRKNWLFVGSESAGKRHAVITSLLSSAKANGLEPYGWLSDTLKRLPDTLNKNLHTLLPTQQWKPQA